MASTEQNFSGALATWKDINLSELQKTLDAQGIELVENQKESVVGRKALADRTKEFKRIPDDEKLTAIKGLLRSYQTEIDSLTKRSKTAENAFLNMYKVLAEAPDPYPLLEAAVDQAVKVAEAHELEAELQRMRDENAELRKRLNEAASLEAAKKKADVRVEQLEQKMEEMIQEKVTQKENELNATYDEKMRNYEEREQDLQRQLTLTKSQLRDLRTSNESNQAKLFDHTQRQDQEVVAKLAELDMVVADLEQANSRVATVERRNELLRAEIEAIKSGSEHADRIKEYQFKVAELESETDRLSRALDTQKLATTDANAVAFKKAEDAARELQKKSAEIDQLRAKLKQYGDYDELKRELEIMKYVEFGGLEEDEDSEDVLINGNSDALGLRLPNPNADKANAQTGKSLEVLLVAKNKRIQEELTKFRVLHGELEASLMAAQAQLDATESELEKQRMLNEKLETDLLQMDQRKPNGEVGFDSPTLSALDGLAGIELGKKTDTLARTTPIPFASSADTSILPIVTSQRDRFRQRNAELEEELRKQFNIISELRTEVKSLQADNLKLYEKVRYMQSYREDASVRPSTLDPIPASAGGRDDMSKYRARYEEAMNPFQAFRGREATRAYESLNPLERGVLVLTRAILGNRRTRTAFICYAIALHLLVMFTTFECTMASNPQLQKQPPPFISTS
ncbi:CASP C terminal-domain-containing protein [Fomitopsis betulina]|nr:CASP C terminal-domain-containing protein [Fomitopsis betulina]